MPRANNRRVPPGRLATSSSDEQMGDRTQDSSRRQFWHKLFFLFASRLKLELQRYLSEGTNAKTTLGRKTIARSFARSIQVWTNETLLK